VATIIKKLELPRCYLVRDEKGKLLRRNIFFLRKRKTFSLEFEEEEDKDMTDVVMTNNHDVSNIDKIRSERTSKKPDRLIYYTK